MRILVPNLGSTSLKCQLFDTVEQKVIASGRIESIGGTRSRSSFQGPEGSGPAEVEPVPNHRAALQWLLARLPEGGIDAVGLKAVHGGPEFVGTVLVTDEVLAAMKAYSFVAPLHNPLYIEAMAILMDELPATPMVAVFETGFHSTIPQASYVYGLPYDWTERYGIRRYGFHGSSHRYVSQRVPEMLGVSSEGLRLVSCHLGGSSSVCAIQDGESIDCSFGFSPQSGLEQGTRCGDVDPFAVLYLLERTAMSAEELGSHLCEASGLLGISGVSSDMREIEEAAEGGNRRAVLALDVFVHEVRKHIGAFAAVMGGVDALAFAGGIGENGWQMRERICSDLRFLGIELDMKRNRDQGDGDVVLSSSGSAPVVVVRTDEELIVAGETVRMLEAS